MISIPLRVISKNIRYATTSPFKGEELWSTRRPYLVNELRFLTAHSKESFICCQEVLHTQLQDILTDLNSSGENWAYIGVGRNDGKEAGEYSPIFYRSDTWSLIKATTTWLSNTPDVPGSVRPRNTGDVRLLIP